MGLTAAQLTDMQGDLGISSDQTVFTNAELDRLYTRASEDYNTAVYLGFRQLLADANKFFDYTVGQTSIKRSQVREHLKEMAGFWREESRTAANQMQILGANPIPPRWKDYPLDQSTLRRSRLTRRALSEPD